MRRSINHKLLEEVKALANKVLNPEIIEFRISDWNEVVTDKPGVTIVNFRIKGLSDVKKKEVDQGCDQASGGIAQDVGSSGGGKDTGEQINSSEEEPWQVCEEQETKDVTQETIVIGQDSGGNA